jgi:hypothetical protein
MADYYPILSRAVAGLPHNDAPARQDLYDRARTIVTEQLRSGRKGANEAAREQAALEAAIRQIESEARPPKMRMKGEPQQTPQHPVATPAQERADRTAKSLAKILQAVQPGETGEASPATERRKSATGRIKPQASETSEASTFNESAELGDAPNSFGTLLFATAYIVTALAFTGVATVRSIVWLYEGFIGYPILLAIMAATLALFVVPPLLVFRKNAALPTIDDLLRFIHSASRRVL